MKTALLCCLFFGLAVSFFNCASKTDSPNNALGGGTEIPLKTCTEQLGQNSEWSTPTEVPIDGYTANAMEPKFSADQVVLFWNDKPATGDSQMNIHYAIKQPSGRYQYAGTVPGTVNNSFLDGVPAVDSTGNFYFVSLRTYETNFQSIFGGQVQVTGPGALQINAVTAADSSVIRNQIGLLDMDIDVSWDGTQMIASRAAFSGKNYPDKSYLELYSISNRVASSVSNSSEIFKNINLPECRVYAATLSNDKKEIFYSVLPSTDPVSSKDFRLIVSKRDSITEPFKIGSVIKSISTSANARIVEGPAISVDGKTLMFHMFDSVSNTFKIYQTTRP